ncbi:type II toxin-antitoxin system RelE/ParE family toxin [Aquabacterium sp. J223]|uniref:type II toxin-antitoxin system RelE/ParE family toxin n=1 Tax=Aquabacterium sp. J223 TaxID=2898431 RepID=UPI0021AE18A9|nr:type II toxin-antitoxin system RelE/ParE family toxin [Aquabacterium sp. J223]UUX96594.1 type II toxin-antitoxin system RelE/ParE family toxin [Aquabacterium sp. J223]
MARLELAPEVLDDFDRFFDHLQAFEVEDIPQRIREILDALQILTHSPLIGRKVRGGLRELVIGQDARGYIALYRYIPGIDTVFVLAVRSEREEGFKRSP